MDFRQEFQLYKGRIEELSTSIKGKSIECLTPCSSDDGDFYFTIKFMDGSSARVSGAACWGDQRTFAEIVDGGTIGAEL
jgi:hypothetical protein